MALSPLIRAALFVADLEQSTAFYRALGFEAVYFEGELEPGGTNAVLMAAATTRTRCRILKRAVAAENFGMVGLFELSEPTPAAVSRPPAPGPARGEAALVFYCDNLEATLAAARAAGASVVGAPTLLVMPHRPKGQREVCLRDPDGVLINLIEKSDLSEAYETATALAVAKARET